MTGSLMLEELFIFCSAVLFYLSFFQASFFFWLSFFWLIPLFYLVITNKRSPSFRSGLLWGLIFFSLHLYPVAILFINHGNGTIRFVLPIILIFYSSFHSALWFFFANTFSKLLGDSFFARVTSWSIITWGFFLFTRYGLFWISGQWIGDPLMFPLLPLVQVPQLLFALPYIGSAFLLFALIGLAMSISVWLVIRKRIFLLFIFLFSTPFLIGFFVFETKEKLPDFVNQIGYIKPPDVEKYWHSLDAAQEIYYRMRALLERSPDVRYIVMPELAYRFALNTHKHVIKMWNNNALNDEVELFIGAMREEENKFYNSVYWIKQGRVHKFYDKSILMPLTEYVPPWCKEIKFFKNVFLKNKKSFCAKKSYGQLFCVTNKLRFEPYVCAEIFFGKKFISTTVSDNASSILCPLNDTLFSSKFTHFLMKRWAQYKAQELNKALLFVGYAGAYWLTNEGKSFDIS